MHIRLHTTAIAEIQGSCRSTGWQFVWTERQIFFFFFKALHLKPSCVSCHLGWGGFTPLHYAALHGNRVLVDLFLSNGADPNLTCDAGQTAFHFGCRWASISSLCHNLNLFPFLSRFLTSMTTDKETSTSCTKWCSTEPTCASQTCKGKRPCIMQWLGGTCKWRRNRIARAAGITFWRRTVCTNSMLLFPVSQCTTCGKRECFASQTLTSTKWHRFTWLHPLAIQKWSDICWGIRCENLKLTCTHRLWALLNKT